MKPIKASTSTIRMLFILRESFPTFRVDIDVLFGKELLRRGHAIDFVMQAASDQELPGEKCWNGRTVWVGPTDMKTGFISRLRRQWLAMVHDLKSLRLAKHPRYDAVQVKDKFLIAAVLAFIAPLRGIRMFYWLSWPIPEAEVLRASEGFARYPWLTRLRGRALGWLLYKWILPRADHIFVQSQRMKEDLHEHGVDVAKMTPVPMGIDPEQMRVMPVKGTDRRGTITFAYLGALGAERRLDILVDMLADLRHSGMDARLLLIGEGQSPADRQLIEERARASHMSRFVEITGFMPRHQALQRLLEADICLSPFRPTQILQSTSPTKLIEYMALGLPVIANDHPEQRLILRESRGGVCVPWAGKHFARAARWMLSRSHEELRDMGARGRRWVYENRTYERIGTELERKYLELLAASV